MATERRAEATWRGSLMGGAGTIERVGSGAFGPLGVSWPARAESSDGKTSPEELIAAAHATCFAMAAAEDAKENCPVSHALRGNVELSLDARLQS